MRRMPVAVALLFVTVSGAAPAALAPSRTVTEPSRITTLGVAHRSVVYAVDATPDRRRCAYVRLWDTATRGLWTFGEQTTRICKEGLSTGSGIASVATSGGRAFWITYGGGNIREFDLWTATPMRRRPRRLAEASSDVDAGERPLMLGGGTPEGVPYAEGDTITYVADSGARRFRVTLPAPVRLLTAGVGPGAARVAAALAGGTVVTLSATGNVLRSESVGAGPVTALVLGLPGAIVQVGREVRVGSRPVLLPAGASLLDFRRGAIVYRQGAQVRARQVATGADTLLHVIPVRPWQPMPFASSGSGSAWARGATVSWRPGPLS